MSCPLTVYKTETWDPESAETINLRDDDEKARMAADPFYRLEIGEAEANKAKESRSTLERLNELSVRTPQPLSGTAADTPRLLVPLRTAC